MAQYQNIIFIIVMVAAFYFLLIRPQQKRQQKQRDMIGELAVGDEIVTIGGIFGTVVEIGERIRVRTVDGSELELAKQAIGQVIPAGSDDESEDADEAGEEEADSADVAEADESADETQDI